MTVLVRCERCDLPVATSDEPGMVCVAGVTVESKRHMLLTCPACRHKTLWRGGAEIFSESHLTMPASGTHTTT